MEEEAEKLRQLQTEVDRHMNIGSPPGGGNLFFLCHDYYYFVCNVN